MRNGNDTNGTRGDDLARDGSGFPAGMSEGANAPGPGEPSPRAGLNYCVICDRPVAPSADWQDFCGHCTEDEPCAGPVYAGHYATPLPDAPHLSGGEPVPCEYRQMDEIDRLARLAWRDLLRSGAAATYTGRQLAGVAFQLAADFEAERLRRRREGLRNV